LARILTEFGREISINEEHPLKQSYSIEETEFTLVMVCKEEQL
jgi:hypothetical protein